MRCIAASAPGKAVLSGEYAVLQHAPAISAAIDCRADIRLATTGNDFHSVTTPGYSVGEWRFRAKPGGKLHWLDAPPPGGLRLIETAWLAIGVCPQHGLSITVDTTKFFAAESQSKLGLGSSAAAMAALVGALCQLEPDKHDAAALTWKAHRLLQNGLGSGVDVATSLHGGVIGFRMDSAIRPPSYPWPAGLEFSFLWSGKPASTVSKVGAFESAARDDQSINALLAAAEKASSAWAAGDVTEILSVFRRYTDTLRQFSVDRNLGIFDAGHDGLTEMAASFDVVYKPCGAGGGDIGIVLANDESALSRFCAMAVGRGFQKLAVAVDPNGVQVSEEGAG